MKMPFVSMPAKPNSDRRFQEAGQTTEDKSPSPVDDIKLINFGTIGGMSFISNSRSAVGFACG